MGSLISNCVALLFGKVSRPAVACSIDDVRAQAEMVVALLSPPTAAPAFAPVVRARPLSLQIASQARFNVPISRAGARGGRAGVVSKAKPKRVMTAGAKKRVPPRKHVWLSSRPSMMAQKANNVVAFPVAVKRAGAFGRARTNKRAA